MHLIVMGFSLAVIGIWNVFVPVYTLLKVQWPKTLFLGAKIMVSSVITGIGNCAAGLAYGAWMIDETALKTAIIMFTLCLVVIIVGIIITMIEIIAKVSREGL